MGINSVVNFVLNSNFFLNSNLPKNLLLKAQEKTWIKK